MATDEIRTRHAHEADPRVKGVSSSWTTAGRSTPKTAPIDMEEGEHHRSLRGGSQPGQKHHNIFDVFDKSNEQHPTSPKQGNKKSGTSASKKGKEGRPYGSQQCPWPPPPCDDGNLCTDDSAFCNKSSLNLGMPEYTQTVQFR